MRVWSKTRHSVSFRMAVGLDALDTFAVIRTGVWCDKCCRCLRHASTGTERDEADLSWSDLYDGKRLSNERLIRIVSYQFTRIPLVNCWLVRSTAI